MNDLLDFALCLCIIGLSGCIADLMQAERLGGCNLGLFAASFST